MNRLETHVSPYDFDTTTARVEAELARRGITVYAHIDHAANAASVGLSMPPTSVLIFGNPRGGTVVMKREPTTAYELPLRLLIRQDADRVLLQYAPPQDLLAGLGLPPDATAPLHVVVDIAHSVIAP
jgi:uncharacterized protein (DUF302 family)